jgi:hypothetical protein
VYICWLQNQQLRVLIQQLLRICDWQLQRAAESC